MWLQNNANLLLHKSFRYKYGHYSTSENFFIINVFDRMSRFSDYSIDLFNCFAVIIFILLQKGTINDAAIGKVQ